MLNKVVFVLVLLLGITTGVILKQKQIIKTLTKQNEIMRVNLHKPFRDDIYLGIEPVKRKHFNYNKMIKK